MELKLKFNVLCKLINQLYKFEGINISYSIEFVINTWSISSHEETNRIYTEYLFEFGSNKRIWFRAYDKFLKWILPYRIAEMTIRIWKLNNFIIPKDIEFLIQFDWAVDDEIKIRKYCQILSLIMWDVDLKEQKVIMDDGGEYNMGQW